MLYNAKELYQGDEGLQDLFSELIFVVLMLLSMPMLASKCCPRSTIVSTDIIFPSGKYRGILHSWLYSGVTLFSF